MLLTEYPNSTHAHSITPPLRPLQRKIVPTRCCKTGTNQRAFSRSHHFGTGLGFVPSCASYKPFQFTPVYHNMKLKTHPPFSPHRARTPSHTAACPNAAKSCIPTSPPTPLESLFARSIGIMRTESASSATTRIRAASRMVHTHVRSKIRMPVVTPLVNPPTIKIAFRMMFTICATLCSLTTTAGALNCSRVGRSKERRQTRAVSETKVRAHAHGHGQTRRGKVVSV